MKLLLTSVASNVIKEAALYFPKPAKDCRVICIPTAAKVEQGPKKWLDDELAAFEEAGYTLTMLDIDGLSPQTLEKELINSDIIYVTGGNSFFLLEKMLACDFARIARQAMDRGAIYIGSSAGTVVCCPDIDYVRTMDDPSVANLKNTTGLNLIDFFVLVHMDHASFARKANDKLVEMKQASLPVICLKDSQALFVDGSSITII